MGYFNEQIMPHLKSPAIYLFGLGLGIATYLGKNMLNRYKKKHDLKMNVNNTIYFFLHFGLNMFCVYNCAYNVMDLIKNPNEIKNVPNTMAIYVFLFHIYHILLCGASKIDPDEMIHHIGVFISCPLLCLNYNNLCDLGMFAMTGLSGGITYLLLSLKSMHYIKSITEKRVSKHLNMWIRCPLCILTSYIIYLNYISNEVLKTHSYLYIFGVWFCFIGTYMNGVYFASTIIESHGVAKYKHKIENNTK